MPIDILLATYNSAKFLRPQLDSILCQTHTDWRLIVSDDNSQDDTIKILEEYQYLLNEKIIIHKNEKNIGAKANFNKLLALSHGEYAAFCDHDDVWLPEKLEITIAALKNLETKFGKDLPALAFTDKSIVDENLTIISKSSVSAEKFNVENMSLNRLLVQNVASGCTMMINASLRRLCGSVPKEALMHDHYLMLLAASFGNIAFINTQALLYRQHSSNEIGATPCNSSYFVKKLKDTPAKIKQRFLQNVAQGKIILEKYGDILPKEKLLTLQQFARLEKADRLEFAKIIIKNGFYKSGVIRKIGMIALLR